MFVVATYPANVLAHKTLDQCWGAPTGGGTMAQLAQRAESKRVHFLVLLHSPPDNNHITTTSSQQRKQHTTCCLPCSKCLLLLTVSRAVWAPPHETMRTSSYFWRNSACAVCSSASSSRCGSSATSRAGRRGLELPDVAVAVAVAAAAAVAAAMRCSRAARRAGWTRTRSTLGSTQVRSSP